MRRALMVLGLLASVHFLSAADSPVSLYPGNPHHLLFRGRPTVVVTSAEHYGAVLNPDFDYIKYLDTLAQDELNYTRVFSGSYVEPAGAFGIANNDLAPAPGRFLAPWARSATAGYANGGNKFDLDKWSPEFFERLRGFVSEAGKREIIVEITLFSSIYGDAQWKVNPFNPANNVNATDISDRRLVNTLDNGKILGYQEQLTRKLVSELSGFDNVLFEIQNEPYSDQTVTPRTINPYLPKNCVEEWQNRVDLANQASLRWQSRIAEFIVSEAAKSGVKRLIAQNVCNFAFPVADISPNASILNFHYAYPEAVRWNYGRDLPISYDETGFLPQSDTIYRTQAWNFMLAGGGIFNHLDYSFAVGHESGDLTDIKAPGWGGAALRKQLRILKQFLESLDFERMRPAASFVVTAPGVSVQSLAWPGRQYAVYLAGSGPCELRLKLPGGEYQIEWVNVEDGAVVKSETVEHRGGTITLISPSFSEDIALRIRSAVGQL